MTELKKVNSLSITEQCYQYIVENDIKRLNIYDFFDYIKPQLNLSEEEFISQMSYFYTDLNVDGRFVCVEDGNWMLKEKLSLEDVQNFTEPSISTYSLDEEDFDLSEEYEEEITDEVDELLKDEEEDEEDEDLYNEYGRDEIVSKFSVDSEEEF
ncbi:MULTISPECIES: DNA-directed RNA polymerase subunit delta [unclassified Gemella]|uniref:DNA-directed RNA polymerase subunit delta n=1 Tax=unclassified Gemella TaxID=2624949 RepID=UPI001C052D0D|nr:MULTISPECIES: DNA-directed RNA polymerase subunit delta [unclassified Gemella]MBU0278405.1 DNA-directed RNA polymerase subunit delta [Gemella sp. zg-1178]QWQ38980.1 DNA-directed RNA polymerase subunit delta [Gemella sp. zg-570]